MVIHQKKSNSNDNITNSVSAVGTAFINSTLKVYSKALVLGCTVLVASGASVGGAVTLGISRGGSSAQVFSIVVSATTSCAGDVHDLSLTTGLTLTSISEFVTVDLETALTLADRGLVLQDIIWRYRMLPQDIPECAND
jgi:hypothetical protein